MSPFCSRSARFWWLLSLTASVGLLHLAGADAPTPPVDVEAPAASSAPSAPEPRPSRFPQLLGIMRDVHLRSHETTEQVVTVFGNARVEGHVTDQVVTVFGNADVHAPVDGQVVVVFGNGTIARDIDGDVVWLFGKLTISPGVTIRGDLIAIGGQTERDTSVHVHGERFELPIPGMAQFGGWVRECLIYGRLYRHDQAGTWVFAGAMLALSLLLAALFRGPVDAGVSVLERRPGLAFVNGLLVVLLTPPAFILLIALVVGIPVVPFLWIGLMFATWIGVISVSRFCGTQIGVGHQPALALVVGFGVLSLLFAVPVIGLFTWGAVMMLGVGTATTAWLESRRREPRANGNKTRPRSVAANADPRSSSVAPPAPAQVSAPAPAPASGESAAPFVPAAAAPAGDASNPFTAGATAEHAPTATPPELAKPATPPPSTPPIASHVVPAAPPPPAPPAIALERVGFWPRIQATLLDFVMVGAALVITGLPIAFVYVWFIYHVAFWAWRGTTLGGVVLNLRIERLDGRPIDASVAIVRGCGAIMSFVALGFGFLWVHWDPEKQSWHDKIAGTVIVRVPRGQALI